MVTVASSALVPLSVTEGGATLHTNSVVTGQLAHRRVARFLRRHAAIDVVLRLCLDVIPNVFVELLQHALGAPHDAPSCSVGRRIRAIAPASLSHLWVSTVSCRRPLGVSR